MTMMMTTTSSSCFCRCSFTTSSRRRTCSSITLLSNLLFAFIIFIVNHQNHNQNQGFAYAASFSTDNNNKITNQEKKAFELLVKTINQLEGGHVHPSIGLMSPAPFTGATRGIGIINNKKGNNKDNNKDNGMLIKVPYQYQMTRDLALRTLTQLIPYNVLKKLPLDELDDAALLVLLLVHEYGLGKKSKFYAYIQTLPQNNGCESLDNVANDFRQLPHHSIDPTDIEQALMYLNRVSTGLSNDYGVYLCQINWSKEWKEQPNLAIRWGLCIVSSRATAANPKPGINTGETSVRLVPLADFANHLITSGGFIELTGNERLIQGDFIDADPMKDAGSFVVRSTWKDGSVKNLAVGDEITVNYNLPEYTAIDWFLSLGFVPPELSIMPSGGEL